ncbi:efflux RND transporter periplasmic adaptor subunit [Neorhizobium alkalisoli]|uniref:RND family efflux transporter MFP subunit n=1 Tax=Neorhizobium alkalisoli TaxID=528178 RepID=A0A561QVF1_9HYPH|nr:efflux RND transporter periplasmic adaptor subunit [Neorhizobium alkalisoli]TWF54335.1 RND family efflux transporter MFP subunit [Neorhizobium alkalisoli]
MRIWNQLVLCAALLAAGLCLWVYLSADAARTLVSMGMPEAVVVAVNPQAAEPAEAPAAGSGAAARAMQGQTSGSGAGRAGEARAVLVAVRPVGMSVINDNLSAIGDGEAIQSVIVMPQATGTVNEILVSSGNRVKKGQVLARLDDEEQTILRDQAAVVLRSAREKSAAYKNLQSFSRLDVLDAQIAAETAQLAVTNAELALKRRAVVAPIDGIVGIVAVNIGDNVTTSSNVVTIDNRSELLVDFWAPERFAVQVKPGMPVSASSISRPGQVFQGVVDAVDNRVDPASRTIRIRARIPNGEDQLRAGMSFGVTMRFPGETYPSVDPLAVQWDSQGSFVWQIVDMKSVKTRVRVVQRNPDAILVSAELKQGDRVAIEGLQRVREGGAVRITGEKPPEVASR